MVCPFGLFLTFYNSIHLQVHSTPSTLSGIGFNPSILIHQICLLQTLHNSIHLQLHSTPSTLYKEKASTLQLSYIKSVLIFPFCLLSTLQDSIHLQFYPTISTLSGICFHSSTLIHQFCSSLPLLFTLNSLKLHSLITPFNSLNSLRNRFQLSNSHASNLSWSFPQK